MLFDEGMIKHVLFAGAVIGFSACTFRCDDEGSEKRASVEYQTEEKEVEVPDIDVDVGKERKTIEVPVIDGDDEELPEE